MSSLTTVVRLQGTSVVFLAAAVLQLQCALNSQEKKVEPSKTVEIWLGDSIQKIRGEKWLMLKQGEPSDLDGVDEPHNFILHFPSGRRIELWSNGASMEQEHGIVVTTMLLPLPKVVDFHDAVQALTDILMRFHLDHDPEMQRRLAKWRTESPPKDTYPPTYSNTVDFEPGFLVYIEIKPHGDRSDQGWYIALNFEQKT